MCCIRSSSLLISIGRSVKTLFENETNTHIVVEAKLVSSSLSLPSNAKPRFSLLLDSKGVILRVFSKFALPSIVSLEKKMESYRLDTLQLIIEETISQSKKMTLTQTLHSAHSWCICRLSRERRLWFGQL